MADAKAAAPGGAIAVARLCFGRLALWSALVDPYRRERRRDPPNETGGKRGWSFPKDLVDAADAAPSVSRP
jgi:hypothetical protein